MITRTHITNNKERIISRLNELAVLPSRGVVAGQSLASIIYEVLELPVKGKINDIDIFDVISPQFYYRLSQQRIKQGTGHTLSHHAIEQAGVMVNDNYNHCNYFDTQTGRGYEVGVSFTDKHQPVINKTLVRFSERGQPVYQMHMPTLVKSFDFTAVQCAWDIAKDDFYFSDGFIAFLNDYRLKVGSVHTPAHTMIRLFKKLSEIEGLSCDVDGEMALLSYRLHEVSQGWPGYRATVGFGQKMFDLYQHFQHQLAEYVDIHYFEKLSTSKPLYGFTVKALERFDIQTEALESVKQHLHLGGRQFTLLWRIIHDQHSQKGLRQRLSILTQGLDGEDSQGPVDHTYLLVSALNHDDFAFLCVYDSKIIHRLGEFLCAQPMVGDVVAHLQPAKLLEAAATFESLFEQHPWMVSYLHYNRVDITQLRDFSKAALLGLFVQKRAEVLSAKHPAVTTRPVLLSDYRAIPINDMGVLAEHIRGADAATKEFLEHVSLILASENESGKGLFCLASHRFYHQRIYILVGRAFNAKFYTTMMHVVEPKWVSQTQINAIKTALLDALDKRYRVSIWRYKLYHLYRDCWPGSYRARNWLAKTTYPVRKKLHQWGLLRPEQHPFLFDSDLPF